MKSDPKGELEIWKDLVDSAEKQFGKARAAALREDLEQVVVELSQVAAYPITLDDEL